MSKETKAQRIERIKKQKDGVDVLEDIYRYAKSCDEIDSEDIDRFKWYGLYTQNRNLQDESDLRQYFMLRVKLPEGRLDIAQIEVLADISKKYGQDTADLTTRQDIQFHFIKLSDIPEIFSRLSQVGLSTFLASGDAPRNVVTCPVNGIDKDGVYDVGEIVKEVNSYFETNRELSNLPRKYKVGISGCPRQCNSSEIQDLSFNAKKMEEDKVLFDVKVGGGLASNKRIASHIGYVEAGQVLSVTKAVTDIYKNYANRDNRRKARLGHLLDEWGVEKFVGVLESKLGFTLQKQDIQEPVSHDKRDHFGVHESLKEGRNYIGCAVKGGRVGADRLKSLCLILKKYGVTTVRTTTRQNIVITDVPEKHVNTVSKALEEIGIYPNPSVFTARTLACTGINFCKFAVSETKGLAERLTNHLQERFPDFDEPLFISVNGCPHSCAHPHIVDIGLLGCKVEQDGKFASGFELLLGGRLEGERSRFAKKSGIKFVSDDACGVVEGLLQRYIESGHKNFHEYVSKIY